MAYNVGQAFGRIDTRLENLEEEMDAQTKVLNDPNDGVLARLIRIETRLDVAEPDSAPR